HQTTLHMLFKISDGRRCFVQVVDDTISHFKAGRVAKAISALQQRALRALLEEIKQQCQTKRESQQAEGEKLLQGQMKVAWHSFHFFRPEPASASSNIICPVFQY